MLKLADVNRDVARNKMDPIKYAEQFLSWRLALRQVLHWCASAHL